ncbi:MAG: fumarate hydratase, partial [Desulfovibrio sp.]|nr:fumarate hydratase [Desulfovibrio sp.]
MKEIPASAVTEAVARLCVDACCRLPGDMHAALEKARQTEPSPVGRDILGQLLENAQIASSENMPICQDTGLAVIFADIGQDVHIVDGDFTEAVNAGVRKGYVEGWLRKSSVAEPLFERKNTDDNTPAVLHVRIVPGDTLRLRLAPKGAGSE